MKKITTILFALILINSLYGEENNENKMNINFNEYLEIIKEKVPELKHNDIILSNAENEVRKSWSLHDVTLNSKFSGMGKKIYADGSPSIIDYSTGFRGEGYLSTVLPSGTRLSIGGEYTQMYSSGYIKNDSYDLYMGINQMSSALTGNSFEGQIPSKKDYFVTNTWDPVIKIQVAQPLIYNWFGFLDRFDKKNAKMKLAIERLKKIENDNEIQLFYKKLYFYWYQYNKILEYLEITLNNSKKLEAQTAEMFKAGAVENDNYQRTKYSVLKYQELYDATTIEYNKIINELSVIIDPEKYNPAEEEFNKFLTDSENYKIEFVNFENTRSSKILNFSKENMEYIKKTKFNSMLPELNLFVNVDVKFHQYRKDPVGDTNTKVDYYSAEYTDPKYKNIDFIAGIEFVYPLGNFKARGEYKETNLMLQDLIIQYDITKNNYNKYISTIINSIETLKKIVDIKNEGLDSLKSRLKTEERKYRQARLELMTKIDTENQIATEEIDLMKTKATLIAAYLDYLKLVE